MPAGATTVHRLIDLLREQYTLHAVCQQCQNVSKLDVLALVIARGPEFPIDKLRRKLKCQRCGGRGGGLQLAYYEPGQTGVIGNGT